MTNTRDKSGSIGGSGQMSVHIGGNASGSAIFTGNANVVTVTTSQVTLPPPETVNIQQELTELRRILSSLESPDRKKIDNAMGEALDEVEGDRKDPNEVGESVTRALTCASKSPAFPAMVETLKPMVVRTASWLGKNWYQILSVVKATL